MMKLETLIILGIAALLVGPFALAQLWPWVYFMSGVCVLLGAFEAYYVWKDNKTLSQKFWAWSKENETGAWLICGAITLAILLLDWHLLAKVL